MVIGLLAVQDRFVQSLEITDRKKKYVITEDYFYAPRYAVDTNAFLSNSKKYAVAAYNTLPDPYNTVEQSDSIKTIDTVRKK
jgi:hypothetical protein